MSAEHRLSQVLTKKLGYYVPISEIGYETMFFYKEELDPTLVPLHIIDHLAEPIKADSASYTDGDGNFYLVIIMETGQVEPSEIWLVNDKVVPNFIKT